MKSKKIINKPKKMTVSSRVKSEYDTDFYKWSSKQAKLLREKDFEHADWGNIIEEIESLGRSDRRALKSHLKNLLMHMLKMEYQPHGMGYSMSWKQSIHYVRWDIKLLIDDSPSLKKLLVNFIPEAYLMAKRSAMAETGIPLEVFPEECPWNPKEILNLEKI